MKKLNVMKVLAFVLVASVGTSNLASASSAGNFGIMSSGTVTTSGSAGNFGIM